MLATLENPDTRTIVRLPSLPATVANLIAFGSWDEAEAREEAARIHAENDLAAYLASVNSADD